MATFHLERVLPYAAADLWDMVSDVQKYPEFIPWITALRAYNMTAPADGVKVFDADVSVGYKMFSERFSTRVTSRADDLSLHMGLLRGPLKRLNGQWKFSDVAGGTRVDFNMDMDFRNPLLNAVLKANLNIAVSKLMSVFEARAKQLYGKA
ncbi:type II toxin-antitoxin system RatA family toxin [Asticcacaulis sp. YBE204]|uniref:type II toxin-antitoxin system RatA family toxin n=1 Tax=Asticcacaulis sp. YBE204 TaxID=1282363 RepID=UPI0003C3DDBD|nr:type II toxin-antitoxin system RatA family toxin [Asticcacaulis sp. YBE204]ESQ78107.1 cyclase [Asticcacaulis sp. YBE204]